jgi:hypothetical protein
MATAVAFLLFALIGIWMKCRNCGRCFITHGGEGWQLSTNDPKLEPTDPRRCPIRHDGDDGGHRAG